LISLLSSLSNFRSLIGDIRDREAVGQAVQQANPTVVIHMAAQPLVRRSYREPVETFATNVQGTTHLLDALRRVPDLKAILVVTTDKVYRNSDDGHAFAEDDHLGGHDPYSASKAAAEMVTAAWAHSFFRPQGIGIAAARAGNVVGGGDWSEDRLVPDLWRAAKAGKPVELRYPNAIRPWQHVLDPLSGYLAYVEALAAGQAGVPEALNFGPMDGNELTVSEVAETVSHALGVQSGWIYAGGESPPEMKLLSLDARCAKRTLNWRPRLDGRRALAWTAQWYKAFDGGADARELTLAQIREYHALGQKGDDAPENREAMRR
jgi:CDP-glucose 4,6-dehydratase